MKRDDPKREAARQAREVAQLNLEILCQGIGRSLTESNCRHELENVRYLIERANTDLLKAVEAKEAADKAYEPYWARRYRRYRPARKSKTQVRQRQIHSHKAPGGNKKSAR
jgi:hypothetical protein